MGWDHVQGKRVGQLIDTVRYMAFWTMVGLAVDTTLGIIATVAMQRDLTREIGTDIYFGVGAIYTGLVFCGLALVGAVVLWVKYIPPRVSAEDAKGEGLA